MSVFPIIFSVPMVQALLDGRKTQTRRIPTSTWRKVQPGDLLYVRESILQTRQSSQMQCGEWEAYWSTERFEYVADGAEERHLYPGRYCSPYMKRRPAIHMPRQASRLTLEVTHVREQQLHRITWGDVAAEGICEPGAAASQHFEPFIELWDSLHGRKPGEAWEDNPAVIALTFKVHRENVDQFISTRTTPQGRGNTEKEPQE